MLPFVHQQYGTKSVNSVPRLTFCARVLHASETVSPTNCEVEVCVRSGRTYMNVICFLVYLRRVSPVTGDLGPLCLWPRNATLDIVAMFLFFFLVENRERVDASVVVHTCLALRRAINP